MARTAVRRCRSLARVNDIPKTVIPHQSLHMSWPAQTKLLDMLMLEAFSSVGSMLANGHKLTFATQVLCQPRGTDDPMDRQGKAADRVRRRHRRVLQARLRLCM